MFAISTPVDEQYAGDGIAARGLAYGMKTIRVDGNDVIAVYNAVAAARKMIIEEKRPCLIEAITYRIGDHSTSDFSQLYRNEEEMAKINTLIEKLSNPIERLEKYLLWKKWITPGFQEEKRKELLAEVKSQLIRATSEKLSSLDDMFNAVYKEIPEHLQDQKESMFKHHETYGEHYDLHKFK